MFALASGDACTYSCTGNEGYEQSTVRTVANVDVDWCVCFDADVMWIVAIDVVLRFGLFEVML